MKPADAVTVSVVVSLDAEAAFDVFTREVDLWWRPGPAYRFARAHDGGEGRMRFEPGAGGRFVQVLDDAGDDVYEVGRVLAWEPGKRLAFEWRGPNFEPGQVTRVDVGFEAVEEGTRVTLTHSGWDDLPAEHPVRHGLDADAFARQTAGWWHRQISSLRQLLAHHARRGPRGDRP